MTTIRALRPVACGQGVFLGPGEIAEVSHETASLLIAMGKAVRFIPDPQEQAPAPAIEVASVAPNKAATRRIARKR